MQHRPFAHSLTGKVISAMSIFGSTQALTIVCSIVRTKLTALWIGPAGVGLLSIYNSTVDLLQQVNQLQLRQTATREISMADTSERRATVIGATRRMALLLGLAGMVVAMICSPLLSLASFGNYQYTAAMAVLAIALPFAAMTSANMGVLQGTQKLKAIARVSLYSAAVGTAVSIPVLYFMRLDGIIVVVLTFALASSLWAWLLSRRIAGSTPPLRQMLHIAAPMLKLGSYLTLSNVSAVLASYIFIAWLNRTGQIDAVGLYGAGFTLINSYVGVIFSAMYLEFFPRLTANIGKQRRTQTLVGHEVSTMLWILMPVVVLFVSFDKQIVQLLYAKEFEGMLPYIGIAIGGVILRAISWSMAYVIIAKGDGRIYVITEIASACEMLAANISGMLWLGFAGIGLAYIVQFATYTLICNAVYTRRYGLRLQPGVRRLVLLATAVSGAAICVKLFTGWWWLPMVLTLPWLLPMAYRHIRR